MFLLRKIGTAYDFFQFPLLTMTSTMTVKSYTLNVPATNMDILELTIKIFKENRGNPRDTRVQLAFGTCALLCRDEDERLEHGEKVTVLEAFATLGASYQSKEEN